MADDRDELNNLIDANPDIARRLADALASRGADFTPHEPPGDDGSHQKTDDKMISRLRELGLPAVGPVTSCCTG